MRKLIIASVILVAGALAWAAAVLYDPGVSPPIHAVGVMGKLSVPGTGGDFRFGASPFDGAAVWMHDTSSGLPLAYGTTSRGDADFAMMVFVFGAAVDQVRVYPHHDHADVEDDMAASVWTSTDGDHFTLLCDPVGIVYSTPPVYGFANNQAPTTVWRGGSAEFGAVNSCAMEFQLPAPARFIGIRASHIGLGYSGARVSVDAVTGRRAQ